MAPYMVISYMTEWNIKDIVPTNALKHSCEKLDPI